MMAFLNELKLRNSPLFFFGLINFVLAILFLVLSRTSSVKVFNVSAWYKPAKFALSIGLYAWTMAWFCYYLKDFNVSLFNWIIIVLFGFEIIYIALQAAKGQLSHYNVSTKFYAVLYAFMAIAASLVTIYTAYVGLLFFTHTFNELPIYYVWSIRLGIVLFVIFAFEGFAMGARLNHSVGALNDNSNLFLLGWSRIAGDLRISHFIGMHAIQVLPLLSYYCFKNTKITFVVAALYGLLALFTLIWALRGKPLLPKTGTGEAPISLDHKH